MFIFARVDLVRLLLLCSCLESSYGSFVALYMRPLDNRCWTAVVYAMLGCRTVSQLISINQEGRDDASMN